MGKAIAGCAPAGGALIVALYGELGAGKTCLVQGCARGLGVAPSLPVTSPTFVLVNEYPGRLPLYHFDLYRIGDWREVIELGWEDYVARHCVIAVEWADRMRELLPEGHLSVHLELSGLETRRITITDTGGEETRIQRIRKALSCCCSA